MESRISHFLKWYEENEKQYQQFAECVMEKLLNALEERRMLHAYHSCRAKSLASLKDKCNKKLYDENSDKYIFKYSDPKNQITDLSGVRIVCYLPQDILPIQHIIEKMFSIDYENSMDKAGLLQSNEVGYLSVHYIVSLKEESLSLELKKYHNMKCEIQLRTVLQDAWSQVFHDRQYKNNAIDRELPKEMLRETNLISGALELLDNEIGQLVKRYDKMAKKMDNVNYQEILDSEVDKEALKKYFHIKFGSVSSRFYNYDNINLILKRFGISTIRDIDAMFNESLVQKILSLNIQLTIDKILMYGMIVNNADKFFKIEENKGIFISREAYGLLDMFVDMGNICKKYDLLIKE